MAEESPDHLLKLRIGFIMDGVESVRSLQDSFPSLHSDLTYVTDPKFFDFGEDDRIKLYKGDPLVIEVNNIFLYLLTIFQLLCFHNLSVTIESK